MATIAVGVPTTNGDGVHPADLFGLLSAAPVNTTTIRYLLAAHTHLDFFDYSNMRGYTFVINPQTVQPQYPRLTTVFPSAQ